jgi:hypothetical protein
MYDMYNEEKNLPDQLRKLLPHYLDFQRYFINLAQYINDVAREDNFGSSDPEKMAERIVETNGENLFFFVPSSNEAIYKALMNRKSYIKIAKKGFRKSIFTKDIARIIFMKIKEDEGGIEGVQNYIDSFEPKRGSSW